MVASKSLLYRLHFRGYTFIGYTLEAETSVSGKAEYLVTIGDAAKRVSFLK